MEQTVNKEVLTELIYMKEGVTYEGITLVDRYPGRQGRWTQHWHDVITIDGVEGFWEAEWEEGLTEMQEQPPYEYFSDEVPVRRVYPHEEVIVKKSWKGSPADG